MVYDWQQYSQQADRLKYSDGARRLLNAVAWDAITEKNQSNLGWAGIAPALQTAFSQQYPGEILPFKWPFHQWLFWWMGAGLIGMILFTAWLFFPVLQGFRKNNSGAIAWTLVITASCWVESTLSFQYGVWLHAWIGAAAWYMQKWEGKTESISE
jgi:O-antigen ligase